MKEISTITKQTMSSLEIAKLTGKNHADVLRDIRVILKEAELGESIFAGTYSDVQNKERPCFNLPYVETQLVISGYSVKHRHAIILRWQELEANQKPLTIIDYARALVASEDQRQLLSAKVEELEVENQENKENNLALAQLMNLSNKEDDAKDNQWAAAKILRLINK